MKYSFADFPLVLGMKPEGNLRRSDLVAHAFTKKITLYNGSHERRVVLHFSGGQSQIRACKKWVVTRCVTSASRKRRGFTHLYCKPAPADAKVQFNGFELNGGGHVEMVKDQPMPDAHHERTCRRSVATGGRAAAVAAR